ncbi:MAG: methyltransferase domain-containing protein [Lachnospiraceae bacterium]|nr:methyltransferase domain-containing protein [Lachnospiraceae bacterium]
MSNYLEAITNALAENDYTLGESLLKEWKSREDYLFDDTVAILEGSIFLAQGEREKAEKSIYKGLEINAFNSELYFMLGQVKEGAKKYEQAQFSYENAIYYSNEEDYEALAAYYEDFCNRFQRKEVSIILVTYNQLDMTKLCVDSIRENVPSGTYEVIIVDNCSTDGTREWLKEQEDIRIILNDDNKGFPVACNQGAEIAQKGNDIFLLNNDTIVLKNSIYNLHMALYEREKTGAVGSCSNNAGKRQRIVERFSQPEGYFTYAAKNNAYAPERHEKRVALVGFAMMVQRDAWEETDGMDEIYGLGNFEDDDICLKLLTHGYSLVFCPDSFIFHYGHSSFRGMKQKQSQEYQELLQGNKEIFNRKWGVSWGYFAHVRKELIEYLPYSKNRDFSILDIGCGSGATLLQIGNVYPNAQLYGMELNKEVVDIASHYLNVVQGNIEDRHNPFDRKFDCIMLGDVLEHLHDAKETLLYLKTWLNKGGFFIISLPNIMHISVIQNLLHGRFEYQDAGILDRTHLRFFTLTEIAALMQECGLTIERISGLSVELTQGQVDYIEQLSRMDPSIPKDEMNFYQYRIRVGIL